MQDPKLTEAISQVKKLAEKSELSSLSADDLKSSDIEPETLGWTGGPLHLNSVRKALQRIKSGEVEMMVIRAPNGIPVAKGGIDYKVNPGSGTIWQLVSHPELKGLGTGTMLIKAMENRMLKRKIPTAMMGVELWNKKAKKLYERLGYKVVGTKQETWKELDKDGKEYDYVADEYQMSKDL